MVRAAPGSSLNAASERAWTCRIASDWIVKSQRHTNLVLDVALPCSPELARAFRVLKHIVIEAALPEALVEDWPARAADLVTKYGVDIRREFEDQILTYRVVTGDTISTLWPELHEFYKAPATRDWIRFITGEREIFISGNQLSRININHMSHSGESYRWHFDASAYTLLLFLSTSTLEDGGAFELVPPSPVAALAGTDHRESLIASDGHASIVSIPPRIGTIVLMDGASCRHRVAPLLRARQRITIPMVYSAVLDDSRPNGLDDYLYKSD